MHQLKFKKDGTFTIVQFTDLHWENGDEKDIRTNQLMEKILKEVNPDLVVFTGDNIYGPSCIVPKVSLRRAVEPVAKREIPWAAVFGNHDSEESASKEELLAVMQESPYCLSEAGNVSGCGNYIAKVLDSTGSRTEWALYFLDSGMDNHNKNVGGYDFIKRDQIEWYVNQSKELKRDGSPSELLFFHIAIPEYKEVWETQTCYGSKNEEVCSPHLNSGLFSALVEMGSAKGTFVGHDHVNDYYGELYGIKLCYGRVTGYNAYGEDEFLRGARIIRLQEGKDGFDTSIKLADGSEVEQRKKEYI